MYTKITLNQIKNLDQSDEKHHDSVSMSYYPYKVILAGAVKS